MKRAFACIHDPVQGRTALAEKGNGATLDGQAIHVSARKQPAHMFGTVKLRFGDRALPLRIVERCQRVRPFIDLRCAAHEYMALASGQLDYGLYRKLAPWDHAAGQLLHAEAGGYARHLDGAASIARMVRHQPTAFFWRRTRQAGRRSMTH